MSSSTATPTALRESFVPLPDSPATPVGKSEAVNQVEAGMSREEMEEVRGQVEDLKGLLLAMERRVMRREGESAERLRRAEEEAERWRKGVETA